MAEFFPHLKLRTSIDPSMEDLPVELTMDILSRLPVKTIIHCKLVCNKWRNLVSNLLFANLHLSRSLTGFIIHNLNPITRTLKWVEIEEKADHQHLNYDRLFSLDLNLSPTLKYTKMHHVGSVNGLICIWRCGIWFDYTSICNPVTREYIILPKLHYREGFLEVVYGFGMSSLTGEYKVVRAVARPSVLEAEVYTLGTGQWRILGHVPVTYRLNTFQEFYGPFLNNRCHWIVSDNEDAHYKICTFDLDKETFQLLPSPPLPVKENHRFHRHWLHRQSLGILKGCLCKVDTYDSELTIWVMKEYGINDSWHKQVVNQTIQWPLYEPIHLIMGLKDGSFLMVFKNKIWVFDPLRKTIEDTNVFDGDLSVWAYRPSFLKLQNFESESVHTF